MSCNNGEIDFSLLVGKESGGKKTCLGWDREGDQTFPGILILGGLLKMQVKKLWKQLNS